MTGSSKIGIVTLSLLAAACAGSLSASAQTATSDGGTAWDLRPNTGYIFEAPGQLLAYRLGTNNAQHLLRGARRVAPGTMFFIGENGQLYMRTGPYREASGAFSFGSN